MAFFHPMSMRSWASRLLLWLAAFSGLLSFALAEPHGSQLGSFAIICGVAALLVWRVAKKTRAH